MDLTSHNRIQGLINVQFTERRNQLPEEIGRILTSASGRGMIGSGVTVRGIHKLFIRELEIRATIIWQNIVRVLSTRGTTYSQDLAEDIKGYFRDQLDRAEMELSIALKHQLSRLGNLHGIDGCTLTDAFMHQKAKHENEIDLYVDAIERRHEDKQEMTKQQYNFYGNVGAFQTGANASANVVQNLGGSDKEAILNALNLTKNSLAETQQIDERRKQELKEIVAECVEQVQSNNPNNTKLLTLFNAIGTSIQSIAAAQPAYTAMKIALLPLGIMLP